MEFSGTIVVKGKEALRWINAGEKTGGGIVFSFGANGNEVTVELDPESLNAAFAGIAMHRLTGKGWNNPLDCFKGEADGTYKHRVSGSGVIPLSEENKLRIEVDREAVEGAVVLSLGGKSRYDAWELVLTPAQAKQVIDKLTPKKPKK